MALVCICYCQESEYRLTNLCSNFVVAITFPRLLGAFRPQGAFGWYAAWNVIGFFAILLFVPETKALSLEELDQGTRFLLLLYKMPYSRPLSLLGTDAHPCRLPDKSATTQHQEIHFPHEGRPLTATLRT